MLDLMKTLYSSLCSQMGWKHYIPPYAHRWDENIILLPMLRWDENIMLLPMLTDGMKTLYSSLCSHCQMGWKHYTPPYANTVTDGMKTLYSSLCSQMWWKHYIPPYAHRWDENIVLPLILIEGIKTLYSSLYSKIGWKHCTPPYTHIRINLTQHDWSNIRLIVIHSRILVTQWCWWIDAYYYSTISFCWTTCRVTKWKVKY